MNCIQELEAQNLQDSWSILYFGLAEYLLNQSEQGEELVRSAVRPLIYQQRRKAKFVGKTAENDDNVFFNKEYIYGVDSRGNAGFGFWQMAYGSDGSTDA